MTGVIELSELQRLPARGTTPATAAATTAAATATATAAAFGPSATKAAALGPRTRLVDNQIAAAQIRTIECTNGLFGLAGVGHLHEGKPSRTASVTVGYQMNRSNFAVHFEGAANLVLGGREIEIPYVQAFHSRSSSRYRKRSKRSAEREGPKKATFDLSA
jgi:hypothetical protein